MTGLTLLGREVSDELRGRTFALVQSLVRLELLFVLAVAPFLVGLIGKHGFQLGERRHPRRRGHRWCCWPAA